jgi:NDP-sugar pyrophosphorylase family protein
MSIRTVVIAAAGRGKRMREYSDQYPKPLVPINGEPFLHYVLESVRAIGCQRIIVVATTRAIWQRREGGELQIRVAYNA